MAYGLRYRVTMNVVRHIERFVTTATTVLILAGAPTSAVRAREGGETAVRMLRLEMVRVSGNRRIKDDIIKSHLGIHPGDAVDIDAFEKSRLRLLDTGYFESVDMSTRPGTNRGDVVLVVDVEERGLASFETGFGYDHVYGWFLTLLGVRFDTPFGTDSRIRLGWRLGFRISGLDAEWESSLSRDHPVGLGVKVHAYNERHLFFGSGPNDGWTGTPADRFQQTIARAGGEFGVRYRISSTTRASVGIAGESVDPDSTFWQSRNGEDQRYDFTEMPTSLQGDVEKTAINGFFLRYMRDTRDYPDYPSSGSYTRIGFHGNTKALGSDAVFTKTQVDASKHVSLDDRAILSGRASGGFITDTAPYYDRFHIGGIYSIRGFEEWSLSPTDGDDAFWLVNTELRFPLTFSQRTVQPRLVGLVFFDAGQGWQRDEVVRADDIQSAVGYGLRLRLPWLGTFGLDAGIPLTDGTTNDNYRIHASLGFSF